MQKQLINLAWHRQSFFLMGSLSPHISDFRAKSVHKLLICCLSTISMVLCKIIPGVKLTLVELGTKLMEDGNQRIYFIGYIFGINHFPPSLP